MFEMTSKNKCFSDKKSKMLNKIIKSSSTALKQDSLSLSFGEFIAA